MITIALAINNADERAAITALLKEQADFRVVSAGSDGYDALKSATSLHPDIIIMDYHLEDIDSGELAPILRRNSPSIALIVLCDKNAIIFDSLKAGITGCLLRQEGYDNLASSIRSVYYGGFYVSKPAQNLALNYFVLAMAVPAETGIPPLALSPTETGILRGIIDGQTDREIAKNLNINIYSLRNCVNRIKKKTGLQNRTQIIIQALLAGVLSL